MNGDGFADIIVGAPRNNSPNAWNTPSGIVYFFNGSSTGAPSSSTKSISSPPEANAYGSSLAVGNIYNDGYTDLAVGAENSNTVYVYQGSNSNLSLATTLTAPSYMYVNGFGASVAIGTGLNPSISEIAVGVRFTATDSGGVFTYPCNNSGPTSSSANLISAPQNAGAFGASVAFGTHNGESELIIGAPEYYGFNQSGGMLSGLGAAYFVDRVGAFNPGPTITGAQKGTIPQGYLGSSVGLLDLNGTGCSDLIIGAQESDKIYIYGGCYNSGAPTILTGLGYSEGFGYSIAH
jgi:hypothetical protein